MSIERQLSRLNVENPYVRASDGIEALEMLKSGQVTQPYIILLDLNMPRMGGHEFLKVIRDDEALKTSVVFILTTSNNEQDVLDGYGKSVAGYFLKDKSSDRIPDILSLLQVYWKMVQLPPADSLDFQATELP